MTEALNATDILAQRLFEAGCRHAFGMPGGEVLTLIDALQRAGIAFHLARHENAAGFMAEGVHHVDGAPAILVATVGPGAVNGVNVVANAEQDRVPLLVLTGCVDAPDADRYTHQVLDHRKVFEPITKATFTLSAQSAGVIAEKALGIATEGRSGPVHIDVPITVAAADAAPYAYRRVPASSVVPTGSDLKQAREWLAESVRPVMLVGLDVLKDKACETVRAFSDVHGIPVITTYKAKGVIPESAPLSLGGAGLSPLADKHLIPFIKQADLVICVGYDPIEMRPGWQDPWNPDTQRVIDITAAPNHHFMHQATLNFITDTGATLALLSEKNTPRLTWADGQVARLKSALQDAFPHDEQWGPSAVVAECRNALPADAIATVDSGAHRILLSQMWTCREPRTLLQSSGLCTMGCAVPLAIGAHMAAPDRRVVSFSGDAGLLMVAGELSTASQQQRNTVFVVFVDTSLALIELKQRQRQLPNAGVDFCDHDYAAIARSFGGQGHTVTNRTELRQALQSAETANNFVLIAAVIEQRSYDGRI